MLNRPGFAAAAIAAAALLASGPAAGQKEKKPPYWASLTAGKALMRTGPGRNYPGSWLYLRKGLPLKVIETYPSWRKVRDPDGATGWMLVHLLADARTGFVAGKEPREMRERPDAGSKIVYRAAPGVVGRISNCDGQWCRLDVNGRAGFIREDQLWGVDPGEKL
jgi:SH3-like domain-containing protein